MIENFVVNAGFGFAARKNEMGNFQGMRLAAATVTGRIALLRLLRRPETG